MKLCGVIAICFLLGVSVSTLNMTERVVADEALPDASVVAYRGGRPPKPPTPPTISEVTLTGVVNDVALKGLTIKAGKTTKGKDQKQWLVFAQSDATEFTIHGTATLDYLRKGQTIEFSAQIVTDEKGADKPGEKVAKKANEEKVADKADEKVADKAEEKVAKKANGEKVADKLDKLTIVSHKGGLALSTNGAKDHAADPGTGRIEAPKEADSDTTLTVPADSDPKAGTGGKPAAKHAVVAAGPKEKIAGRIAAWDKEKRSLTVTSGQRTIHVDLADIPTINVEISLSDPKLVPDTKDKSKSRIEGKGANAHLVPIMVSDLVGAKIAVQGTGAESKQGNQCMAKSIQITLTAPLTGNKKSASPDAKKTLADK